MPANFMNPAPNSDKNARPPEEVRFSNLHVEPWPDGNKIRVHVELTSFSTPPSLEVSIIDQEGREISSASIIETATRKIVFTMHLRTLDKKGPFILEANIIYPSMEPVDQKQIQFDLPGQE
jgi:hypothetical protein